MAHFLFAAFPMEILDSDKCQPHRKARIAIVVIPVILTGITLKGYIINEKNNNQTKSHTALYGK